MSTGELLAWQAGVDWSRAGYRTAAVLDRPRRRLAAALGPAALDCRDQLGPLTFGYWFRRGIDDHQATLTH